MRYTVATSALNLRDGPGTQFPIKATLVKGTEVYSEADGWVYVRVGTKTGWVAAQHLNLPVPEPPWLKIARDEVGVTEVAGPASSPRVLEYHKSTGLAATEDAVPWCSAFACWVMEQAGFQSTRSASARSWLKWGKQLDKPQVGCIAVLSRGNPPAGHVGFVVQEEENRIRLLGGNQGDAVSIFWYQKDRVIGYRWPPDTALRLAA